MFIALAIGVAGFFWWKKTQQDKDNPQDKAGKSPFKFPTASKQKQATAASSTSNLPRNKTSNNKKNKSRKKEEKAKREEKKAEQYVFHKLVLPIKLRVIIIRAYTLNICREKQANTKSTASEKQEQASSAVVNYTYFDTARRDTVLPLQKRKTLTAEDVMLKENAEKTTQK